ncbi:MAG: outer membrane beta-barrel protein [Pseudomonadales bacterium]|nr:outer membrane beta-barrel protein [Pseudomonadales bacterium]
MFLQLFGKLKAFSVLAFLLALNVSMVASSRADSLACSAEEGQFSEWCFYVGAGVGLSQFSGLDDADSSWKIDDVNSTAVELYAGYHFSPRWFAEFSYTDYGEIGLVNPYGGTDEFAKMSFSAMALKGGYYVPVSWLTLGKIESSSFQPFVKMGLVSMSPTVSDSRVKFDEGGSIKPQFTLGVDWRFAEDWQLRGQWEMTSELANVTQLSVNYLFSWETRSSSKPVYQAAVVNNDDYTLLTSARVKTAGYKAKATYDVLYFNSASTKIVAESASVLDKVMLTLTQYPHLHISIMDANMRQNASNEHRLLSQQRAEYLREMLILQGVPADRVDLDYYRKPVDNHYQAADFFGRKINVKTLVLAPLSDDTWALFNR